MNLEIVRSKELISSSQNIEELEGKLLHLPQESCPVTHSFGPGVYLREVHLPKGSIVVGHHQNFYHMNIFVRGKITFFSETGPVELKAPMSFVAKPGRKIAYIHEDSIWVNVYSTNETDVEKLEAHFLTKSDTWQNDQKEREKVELLTSSLDKKDFSLAMKEYGWTEEKVRQISEYTNDMIALPIGSYKIKTGPSKIEGIGIFATADIAPSEVLAPARINGKRTIAGRYTNHSLFPNAKMVRGKDSDIDLIAIRKINGCQGGQDGEEITINYRESLDLTLEIMGELCRL